MGRYLSSPKRQPKYRGDRNHEDFVCGLNCSKYGIGGKFESSAQAIEKISSEIQKEFQLEGFRG